MPILVFIGLLNAALHVLGKEETTTLEEQSHPEEQQEEKKQKWEEEKRNLEERWPREKPEALETEEGGRQLNEEVVICLLLTEFRNP